MSYFEQLHPWCIVRTFPNLKYLIVARFRRRNDAIAHSEALRRLVPNATFTIVFEPPIVSQSLSQKDDLETRRNLLSACREAKRMETS